MPKEKPQTLNPCDEHPEELRNALAQSADNFDPSRKRKEVQKK